MREFIIFMVHDQSDGYKFVDLIETFFISNKIGFNIYERTRSKGCGRRTEFEWVESQPEYNGDVLEVWRRDERKPGREATSAELYLIVLFSMEISRVREESCGGRCTRPRTRGFSFSPLPHVF